MNQSPVKQHLVPEVYLKRFAYEGKMVYKLPIKAMYPKTIVNAASVSSICYGRDFFTIKTPEMMDRFGLNDPYHIERNEFEYEDLELTTELDKLTNNGVIGRLKARRIIEIILDIKRRSPAFKEMFLSPKLIDEVWGRRKEAMQQSGEKYKEKHGASNLDVTNIVNKLEVMLKNSFADTDFANDSYLESFVSKDGQDAKMKDLIEELANHKFHIFRTRADRPFITSDNPAFTLIKGDKIENTAFAIWRVFAFPIDPCNLLVLQRGNMDSPGRTFKEINYIDADDEMLRLTNNAAIDQCNKLIISNQYEPLERVRVKWQEHMASMKNNNNG